MNEDALSPRDKTIGQNLENARAERGCSIEDLAEWTGIAKEEIQLFEKGAKSLDPQSLDSICKALNVAPESIIGRKEQPSPVKLQGKPIALTPHLRKKKYTTIKVWLIIGCILTPLVVAGSIIGSPDTMNPAVGYIALALYALTIPLCIWALKRCRKATSRNDLITPGVVSLLFVSLIGGILLLATKDSDFEGTAQN